MALAGIVDSWSYPEDNCYNCFNQNQWGNGKMYFCRHLTGGLYWGSCCYTGSSSSFDCQEMLGDGGATLCSNASPKSAEMKYFYCMVDPNQGMKACGLESSSSSYELTLTTTNKSVEFSDISRDSGYTCSYLLKTDDSWSKGSRVLIYPYRIENVEVYLTYGANR